MTVSSAAWADDAHEKAAGAFQEGRHLIETGNCDAAVPKLRESLQYESSIGARLSIVDCIEGSDPLAAWRILKEAATLAMLNHDDRFASTEQRAAALQPKIAVLAFRLPTSSEPGFDLRVDGEVVDRFYFRSGWATTPGRHTVEAFAPGKHYVGIVNAETGRETPVEVILQADTKREKETTVIGTDRGAGRRALGLALGSAGLAGVATGVVFGILTLNDKKRLQERCGGDTDSCTASRGSLDAQSESAKTNATLSTVTLAVGGTALLAGVAIYLTAPSANGAPRTGVTVSPRASRDGAGVGVAGAF